MNGTHQNFKILGTAGYWVPRKFQKLYQPEKNFWVPMGTGYRPDKKIWVTMGAGYRQNFNSCRPLVERITEIKIINYVLGSSRG